MVIGNHIAIGRNEEAGTGGVACDFTAVIIAAADFCSNGHHSIYVLCIHIAGSHTACSQGFCRSGSIPRNRSGSLLGSSELIIHTLQHGIHFFLPVAVQNQGRCTAAAKHQCHCQHHAQQSFQTLSLLTYLGSLGRILGYVFRFFLGLLGRIIIIKIAHKASPYSFSLA